MTTRRQSGKGREALFPRCHRRLDRVAELGGGCGEPGPEAPRIARSNRKLVGGAIVELPELAGDQGNLRGGRVPRLEGALMEIEGAAFGEYVPRARAGEAEDG